MRRALIQVLFFIAVPACIAVLPSQYDCNQSGCPDGATCRSDGICVGPSGMGAGSGSGSGSTGCAGVAGDCSNGQTCCSNLVCDTFVCGPPNTATGSTGSAGSGGNGGTSGACSPPGSCVGNVGDPCSSMGDCCTCACSALPTTGSQGVCLCSGAGGQCATATDCCPLNPNCLNNLCRH